MSTPVFPVPARIETERVVVRRYTRDDAEQLVSVVTRNVPHLRRYMEWVKFEPQSAQQRRDWIAETNQRFETGEDYTLGMFDQDGVLLGGTGVHVKSDPDRLEIGYWIDGEREGRGYVTEVAAALTWVALAYAGADIVDIAHAPSNERSAAVPARLGYTRQETDSGECFDQGANDGVSDAGAMVASVVWRAYRDNLTTEPLVSFPRPTLAKEDGTPIEWPA
jgi:RimJ/RimL family protein N-acetyltransferase